MQVPPQSLLCEQEVPRRIWHHCQAYFKAKVRELYVSRLQIAYKFHIGVYSLQGRTPMKQIPCLPIP